MRKLLLFSVLLLLGASGCASNRGGCGGYSTGCGSGCGSSGGFLSDWSPRNWFGRRAEGVQCCDPCSGGAMGGPMMGAPMMSSPMMGEAPCCQ
jgi:hypothetical protein